MCIMPLSCGYLPAPRDKRRLADTSEAGCCEMQTAGNCVILATF